MTKAYKEIIKHSLIYGISGILSRAIGFLMIPVYTRYLTPADYGVIELLDIFLIVVGLFVNMGISMSVFKFYYKYNSVKERYTVISTAVIMISALAGIFIIIGMYNMKGISTLLFQSDSYANFIKIILVTFMFENINVVMLSFVRTEQKSILYSVISVLRLAVGLCLNIYFIVLKEMGVVGILYSNVIVAVVGVVILGVYTVRKVGIGFSMHNAKEMLRYGFPLIPSAAGMFIINFGDRFILQRYTDLTELGLYSLAYKFGFLISFLLIQPFSLIWDAKMFEIEKQADAAEVYSKVFTYFTAIMIFAATAMTVLIRDLMQVIAAEEFYEAYKIVPFIAFSYAMSGCCYLLRMGLYLRKKTNYIGIIMMVTTGVTLVLYISLIPSLGALGAALSTLISFLFWSILTYVISQRSYRINYEWSRIIKVVGVSIGLMVISYLIKLDSIVWNILLQTILIISFPVILGCLNFFTLSELESIKKIKMRVFENLTLVKLKG